MRRRKLRAPSRPTERRSQSWRLHVLIEAGYPLPLAERMAYSDADLHTAVELVRPGLRARRPPPRSCSN